MSIDTLYLAVVCVASFNLLHPTSFLLCFYDVDFVKGAVISFDLNQVCRHSAFRSVNRNVLSNMPPP